MADETITIPVSQRRRTKISPAILLGAVAILVLIVAAVVLLMPMAPLLRQLTPLQTAMALLGVGVGIVFIGASILASRAPLYRASLIRTAFWLPGIVSVLTVTLFLVLGSGGPSEGLATDGFTAIVFGVGFGVIAWVIYAGANQSFSRSDTANSRSFSQLTTRRKLLGATRVEYSQRLHDIMAAEDERWVLGTGYLDAWEVLHRAEEDGLLAKAPDELVSEAFQDWLRLRGSNIPNSESISEKTRMAAGYLIPDAYPYFLDPTGLAKVNTPQPGNPNETLIAKQMIRGVRKAVNVYREERYDRIVRARNQLFVTTMFTALVGYLGLGLALLAGVPPTAVFAASAYFVVGALIGLIVRLRTDSSKSVAMEDYGLSTARMLHVPLLSGLVGIAGVALIALAGNVAGIFQVASSAFGPNQTPITAPATPGPEAQASVEGTAPATEEVPRLIRIFDVAHYPEGLVIAAIFGFSPPLLLRGLQKHIDQYKLDIAASEPGGTPQKEE
jgi:hypothetical protein